MWLKSTITIANGQTDSPEFDLQSVFPCSKLTLTFFPPGTLPESVTVKVAPVLGGTYVPLQSGGSNYTVPAAKASMVPVVAAGLKLSAGSAVGADRVFTVMAARSE